MGHVFIYEDTFDELGVGKGAADFAINFDEVKEDVPAGEVGDGKDSIDGNLCEMFMIF